MTASTRAAGLAQLGVGGLLTIDPSRGLRLLRYPYDRATSRTVLRVLGGRHLLQGTALLLRDGRRLSAIGAGIDTLHAATCLLYARHSVPGRRAGHRNAALALLLAALQVSRRRLPAARRSRRPCPPGGSGPRR